MISSLHIYYEAIKNKKGSHLTKPLLMPLLILFYLTSTNEINYLLVISLIFAFFGDVFLMWSKKEFNVLMGITSFLLGHLLYIFLFINSTSMLKDIPYMFYLLLIPYVLFDLYLIKKLFPSMKTMKFPSFIYMSIILIMSFTSLSRIWSVSFLPFLLPFIGSIFFIISDTLLAFDMFKYKHKDNNVVVMITYIVAQLLIVLGFII